MIRKRNGKDITDEEFLNIILPFENVLEEYFIKNVVYEYPLSEAIKDGYTRVPYAVTRTDIDFYHFGNEALDKLMLNDGIKCHKMIKSKLEFYAKANKKRLVKPFMLVVCQDTDHAKIIEDYIKSNEFENGNYRNKTEGALLNRSIE